MDNADRNDPESRLALVLLRASRLWDQAELARAARISPSQISAYERGERATPRDVLERAAEATGFPVYLLDSMLSALRSFRAAARSRVRPDRVFGATLSAEILALSQEAVDLVLAPLAQPSRPEPEGAEVLWANLEVCTAAERRMLVEDLEEYWSGDLCMRVAAESRRRIPDDPREALDLAEIAVLIADLLPKREARRPCLQAHAWAHLSCVRQSQGDETGAQEALERAQRMWEAVTPGEWEREEAGNPGPDSKALGDQPHDQT